MAAALPKSELQRTVDLYIQLKGNKSQLAKELRIDTKTVYQRLERAVKEGFDLPVFPDNRLKHKGPVPDAFQIDPLPEGDITIEELIEHRMKQFEKKQEYEDARRLVHVKVKTQGPIGIWHFGDPHLDDDGTDLRLIKNHIEIINATPGLFGANVGDTQNNWIGRLAHLWSQQSTSARQAWKLVDWFIHSIFWLYILGGNHDAWSGEGDPIKWMMNGQTAPYSPTEVRLQLDFPNGNHCRINARHDFSGHSQYNPAHGPMKANLFGARDHISIAGHKHISAHGVLKNPDDQSCCHSFLVAGYKIYDRFAMEKGFRDQRISPGVLTIIDPTLPNTHPDFITHFWTLERGVEYLNYLRRDLNDKPKQKGK